MGEKEQTFYMTYAGRTYPNDIIPWVEENNVPIMTNAKDRWSEAREAFLDMFEYDTRRCIDSGGFNSQGDYVDRWGNLKVDESVIEDEKNTNSPFFPWSVEEYHAWLSENQDEFEWVATMDYACEARFDTLWALEERIDATIENTIRHFEMGPEYKLVPILQGRSVEDYVYCYEKLGEEGIPLDEVGLGTVCRLSSEKEIIRLEKELRERLPEETKIHGFGVKVNAFKLGAAFDSADSHAWVAEPRRGRVALLERDGSGLRMTVEDMKDDARRRTMETFKTYYSYVSYIMEGESKVSVDEVMEDQQDIREEKIDP